MSYVVVAGSWPPPGPTLRDFLVSPGFAGIGIAAAAIILLVAVLYTSRRAERRLDRQLEQQDQHQQERHADRERDAGIKRCWERLVWLVDTAAIEPTGMGFDPIERTLLGLTPEMTLALVRGLHRDAKALGDDTLTDAVTVYLTQFSAVLTQRGGQVADTTAVNGHLRSATTDEAKPASAPATESPATPAPPGTVTQKGRRRA